MEEAGEAMRQGRHSDAVKICKQVLKQDRSNYEGFVVLGTALLRSGQHLEQAEMSFRKAISIDSSSLPAYQGMIELREATGNQEQILQAYEAAAKAAMALRDSTAAVGFVRKLASMHSDAQRFESVKISWQEVLSMELNDEQRLEALSALVDAEAAIMEKNIQEYYRQASTKVVDREGVGQEDLLSVAEVHWVKTEGSISLESHLMDVLSKMPHHEVYRSLLMRILIYKIRASTGQGVKIVKKQLKRQAMEMLSWCPTATAADVLLAMTEEDDAEEIFEVDNYAWLGRHIAHLYPGRGITLATLNSSSFKSSRKALAQWELVSDDTSISGWRMLAKEFVLGGLLERAFESTNKGFGALARKRKLYGMALKAAELELRLIVAGISLLKKNHNEAARIFLNVSEEAKYLPDKRRIAIIGDAFQGLVKLSLATKQTEIAKSRLEDILSQNPEDHWALSERGWLAFEASSLDQAKEDLEKAVYACQDSAVYHYRLGRVYWEMKDMKEKAMSEFLESAKLDPNQSKAFLYLGHYYRECSKDLRRAVRCYQKAVSLEPEDASAGELLCDILDNGGQHLLEKNICEEASKKSPRAFWAWRRLGYIQVAQNHWSEAVTSAQYGLRGYPTDPRLWEALALAYKKLGMFTASAKAFGRAFELDNSSLFAALEIGAIQLMLSAFSKAINAYREALRILPGDLTGMYGLAASLIGQARECLHLGAVSWCSTLLKEAIGLATRNTMLYGDLVTVWKQLGNANLLYAQVLPFDASLTKEAVNSWHNERLRAANNAVHAFKCAIHLLPNEASFYHDLAIAMEYIATLQNLQRAPQWSESEIIACSGLKLDGANAHTWVALGLVTRHKGLKQHAFIQALRLNQNHALAWAYLGQLYITLREQVLAQYAFDRARSADPSLALPWAGMAVIRSLSNRKEDLIEAFANCSCAVQLSSATDVHIGLGQLAAETQNLNLAQVYAALSQTVKRNPLQAAVHNLKGISTESRSDLRTAISAYENARAAATLSSDSNKHVLITSNLARALCKAGDAQAALVEYDKLVATGTLTDLGDIRGYAISLMDSGRGNRAEGIVRKALTTLTSTNAQYVSMLVLLAKITYYNQGPVFALNILLEASDIYSIDRDFCLTALSLGICSSRHELLSAALNRCRAVFSSGYAPDAYLLLSSGNHTPGVTRNLIKAVHMYPQNGSLRAKLGHIILSESSGMKATLVEQLCSVDSINSDDKLTRKLTCALMTDAALASSNYDFLRGTQILRNLQRLVYKEPSNVEARYRLILFLMQDARKRGYPRHICQSVARMSRAVLDRCESSYMRSTLELCISECESRNGNYSLALDSAKSSLHMRNFASILQLSRCYYASKDSLSARQAISGCQRQGNLDNPIWQLSLIELELRWDMIPDDTISKFREKLHGIADGQRWLSLLESILARVHFEKRELQLSENAASKAISLWPNNPILSLLHGTICLELVKSGNADSYLSKGISSLSRAVQGKRQMDIPVASALLAQAESNRDGTRSSSLRKWANHLRREFLTWPTAEYPIPAELYFQMALVAKRQFVHDEGESPENCPEMERNWKSWLQIALHMNPACPRYWALAKQA